MMGIRSKTLTLLLLMGAIPSLALAENADQRVDSAVNDLMAACLRQPGNTSEREHISTSETERCIRVRCVYATANVDEGVSIAEGIELQRGSSGAYVGAWKRECVQLQTTEQIADQAEREIIGDAEERERLIELGRRADQEGWEGGPGGVSGGGSGGVSGGSGGGFYIDLGPFRRGDQIYVDGNLITVGGSEYQRICLDSNGNLKSKCRRAEVRGSDIDWVVGNDIDQGNGSRRVYVDGGPRVSIRGGLSVEDMLAACSSDRDLNQCLGARYGVIMTRTGDIVNCADCQVRYREQKSGTDWGGILGGVAEVAGAVLPPVMGYMGQKAWANAYLGSNEAWAGAAATGFEQCRMMQTHYVDATYGYISGNELPDREVIPPECNGYGLGGYAGFGNGYFGNGYGGFGNPWTSGGYTGGFLGGMYGPGLGYNPYFNASAGFGNPYGGLAGPYGGGFGMGGFPGMGGGGFGMPGGGFGVGVGLNTGFGGGMPGAGGFGMPGYGGFGTSMPAPGYGGFGGFGNGGFGNGGVMCIQAPCPGAGYGGFGGGGFGMPGYGGGGGLNIGFGLGGGKGGFGGYPYNGGYGGYYGGNGGFGGWNGQAGFPQGGSYWNNSVNGQNGFWAVQNSHMSNQASLQAGSYYQQAALANQVGQAQMNYAGYAGGGGGYGGYGGFGGGGYSAGYSPFNLGVNLGFGFGGGF